MTAPALTQHPVRALTSRLGELKEEADRRIADLSSTLKHIDETKALLNEHGLQMVVDLGPVGNAAANERRKQAAEPEQQRYQYVQPQNREQAA